MLVELLGVFGALPLASDFTWLGLLATALFVWFMLELLDASPYIWVGSFFTVIIDGLSSLYGLYSRIEYWDVSIHLLGGILVGTFGLEFITRRITREHVHIRHTKLLIFLGVLLITTAMGFLYEFGEYLVDRFQYGYPKSLVNAYDSIEDQVMNLLGSMSVLAIYFLRRR
jgi:hypothetical protein